MPRQLDYQAAKLLTGSIANAVNEDEILLDFSDISFAYPLATLVIGSSIRNLARDRRKAGKRTSIAGRKTQSQAISYLEHIGFFGFLGIQDANPVGAASGSRSYIPIQVIGYDRLGVSQAATPSELQEAIQKFSEEKAEWLAPSILEYEIRRVISYSLREALRNVFEHAQVAHCFLVGQKYNDGRVEIALLDEGVGIKSSLLGNSTALTDQIAIESAVKPGVSRAATLSVAQNVFDNSGYGLYVLSCLGRSFGRFVLGSGSAAMRIDRNQDPTWDEIAFDGTFVGFALYEPPNNFSSVLDDIIEVGETEAKDSGNVLTASKRSRSAAP